MEVAVRRVRRIRNNAIVIVAVVVLVGLAAGIVVTRRSTSGYQLATVRRGSVAATVVAVGTLVPSSQTVVVPPVDGVVASVNVHVGERVAKGATLATLDPSQRTSESLQTEESALAQAESALAQAEDPSQASSTPNIQTTHGAGTGSQAATKEALASLCARPEPQQKQACSVLSAALASSAKGNASTAQNQTVSQTTVADDQAIVSADEAQIASLQASSVASLIAPMSGTVASVGFADGQDLAADSATESIAIIDPEHIADAIPVSISQASEVHVGDATVVQPVGTTTRYQGSVVAIGTNPTTSTATGLTTVVVTVDLEKAEIPIFDGVQATTTITIGRADGVVEVPTSAIQRRGARTLVDVLKRGAPSPVIVSIGVMGAVVTQVKTGLHPGEQVVLATLNKPLPSTTGLAGGFAGFSGRGAFAAGGGGAFRARGGAGGALG